MTNRKDPQFAWVFDHWKKCAGKLPRKRLRVWNSSNDVQPPPLIPPIEGGKVPSPLVGEDLGERSFRVNAIKIWLAKEKGRSGEEYYRLNAYFN